MATTPGGSTYVLSTDLVADYPTASLALANRVDVVASGGPNSIKTAGYTITLADILGGNKFLYNSASPGTFTLPTSGLVDGMVVNVAQIGAGALTVSGGTIVGTTVTTAQYQTLRFVYVASGTTWYSIAPPSTAPGLAIVTPTSISNSGGSASASGGAITFSAVNSISLNGVFNATYDNYLIQTTVSSINSSTVFRYRYRLSGTDAAAGNYDWGYRYIDTSGTAWEAGSSGDTQIGVAAIGASQLIRANINIFLPAQAIATYSLHDSVGASTIPIKRDGPGRHTLATAYDGISFFSSSGTITGTLRVYGYRNS
jgi:hypothetical protein